MGRRDGGLRTKERRGWDVCMLESASIVFTVDSILQALYVGGDGHAMCFTKGDGHVFATAVTIDKGACERMFSSIK